ncbi:hypothetical protein RHSIM_Rhsim04G0089600 [Rhododendron simsii]|uniref:Uncharacterized protein n=1 Tax=Rhododendron simsii TaxID=118357 RepID=A0A834LQW7_RHOSS|nr:hypothetical protein RHSIM_Rhsim04G0089600 [Rhododendron simsii]
MERSLPSLATELGEAATELGCRAQGSCLRTRCFLQLQMRMGPRSDVSTAKGELVRDPSGCSKIADFSAHYSIFNSKDPVLSDLPRLPLLIVAPLHLRSPAQQPLSLAGTLARLMTNGMTRRRWSSTVESSSYAPPLYTAVPLPLSLLDLNLAYIGGGGCCGGVRRRGPTKEKRCLSSRERWSMLAAKLRRQTVTLILRKMTAAAKLI